jgi:hypothetical protein
MKDAKIFKILNVSLNLDSRVKFLEDLLQEKHAKYNSDKVFLINDLKEKCGSCFSKSELAHLFYCLMDEGILFFDSYNEKSNRSKFQDYIISNFTYAGDGGLQVDIKSISKEFSQCKGFSYKEKQIKLLDELLFRIQKRKEKLMNW